MEVLFHDLHQSEERYRNLVSTSPDAIVVMDQGKLLYANAAALQLYGAPDFEALDARDILQWISPGKQASSSQQDQQTSPVSTIPVHQGKIIRSDGQEIPVEIRVSTVMYDGRMVAQAILRDLSEQMKTQQNRTRQ